MDPHEQRQREESYRGAAQARLDEPVLAAGLFPRTGGLTARVSRLIARRRDSGEPDAFMIAITPLRLHVFAAAIRGEGAELGDEVAAWDRAAVEVKVEKGAAHRKVTIEAASTGDTLVCASGNDALSGSVLRYMQDPAVVAA